MVVNKSRAEAAAVFIIYFTFSLLFSPYYITGDQKIYRDYYDVIEQLGVLEAYIFYSTLLNANEPVYFLSTWLAAGYVEKDVFMSLANAILATSGFMYLRRARVSPIVICIFALNFYLLVLMFAAERLKFGVAWFLLALLFTHRKRSVFAAFSMLSHFQMLILFAGVCCKYAANAVSRAKGIAASWGQLMFRTVPLSALGIALLVPAGVLFSALVINKIGVFYVYASSQGLAALLRPSAFLVLSLVYARGRRVEAAALHLPIVVAAYFLGSERLTIFSYMAFLYYGLAIRRGLNVGVIASSTYFAGKGVMFLTDILLYGRGFDLEEVE